MPRKVRVCNDCSAKAGDALKANLLCFLKRHRTEVISQSLWWQTKKAEQRESGIPGDKDHAGRKEVMPS